VITEDYFSMNNLIMAIRKECKGRLAIVSFDEKDLNRYVSMADNIYLAGSVTDDLRKKVVSYCTLEDKRVYIIPEIFEIAVRNSAITYIGDTPVFAMESFHLTEIQRFVKRIADIVLSLLGIVVTFPIFLFAVIGIKHEDHGPVFYRQERSGLKGRPFEVIKFRSMVVDAEKDTGAILATENDQRITKIGSLMRSERIDEIPQFFNVLMGSMSLVGPRPERPVFVEEYSKLYPEYQYRMAVKPGITGLAQVRGNYTTTAENKIKFDLMYIINYSLLLDIKILIQTVRVVFKRDQAKGFDENGKEHPFDITNPALKRKIDQHEYYNDCSIF
jgi:exopolysaccharide biosynthesis polyprenyl glycosylphosphotransferase